MGIRRVGKVFILGVVLSIIGIVSVITGIVLWSLKTDVEVKGKFGVVIDAGGSSTKISIFEEKKDKNIIEVNGFICEDAGVAKYTSNITLLERRFNECLRKIEKYLPSERLSSVSLYFGATAGMRMLKITDSTSYQKILNAIRKVLKNSAMKVEEVDTLKGQQEGIYGWVALNYLDNGFKTANKQKESIEMGSSSSQLVFLQKKDITTLKPEVRTVKIFGKEYSIYSHSYLCFGRNEFGRRYFASLATDANFSSTVNDPCHFKGDTRSFKSEYLWKAPCSSGDFAKNVLGKSFTGPANRVFTFKGTGDPTMCMNAVKKLIIKTACGYSHCGINGVKQPLPTGFFTAYSAMYYPVAFMGLKENISPDKFLDATEKLCKKPIGEVRKMPKYSEKYSKGYCLSAMYTYVFLTHGVGFDNKKWNINFKSKVNGKKLTWRLGLQVLHEDAMSSPVIEEQHDIKKAVYNVLFAGGAMIFFMGILCLALWIAMRIKEKEVVGSKYVMDEGKSYTESKENVGSP